MKRYLTDYIKKDLSSKIVLLSGPRQAGKTTLSRSIYSEYEYLNYDSFEDRILMKKLEWKRTVDLVVFDEVHKMKNWKSWIKGIYDKEGVQPQLLVTGSAKMDIVKKMGDSLAGRYFSHRLFPLDIAELKNHMKPQQACEMLLKFGGFPEPFLKGSETFYKRWRLSHLEIILRQDLLDLVSIRNISLIETLVELLRRRVSQTVSYLSLARDLEVDVTTIKRWLTLLENLFIIFRVTPYSKKIIRSILKEPKYYFYDNAAVVGDEGVKIENMVANSLLKKLHFNQDTKGDKGQLHYLRTKNGQEIDFLVVEDNVPKQMIEVKLSDDAISKNFFYFHKMLPNTEKIQLIKNLKKERDTEDGFQIRSLVDWLCWDY